MNHCLHTHTPGKEHNTHFQCVCMCASTPVYMSTTAVFALLPSGPSPMPASPSVWCPSLRFSKASFSALLTYTPPTPPPSPDLVNYRP